MATVSTPQYLIDRAKRAGDSDGQRHRRHGDDREATAGPELEDQGAHRTAGRQRPHRDHGPVFFADSRVAPSVIALGPDATQTISTNKAKDYSTSGWSKAIEPSSRAA